MNNDQSTHRRILVKVRKVDFLDYIQCKRNWIVLPVNSKNNKIQRNDQIQIKPPISQVGLIGRVIGVQIFKNIESLSKQVDHGDLISGTWSFQNVQTQLSKRIGLDNGVILVQIEFHCPNYKNKFVITGGPGFGKSTILNELNRLGYSTFPEAARMIIDEQKQTENPILPWTDRLRFDEAVIKKMEMDYNTTSSVASFFDRGFPDLIGWRRYAKLGTRDVSDLVYIHPYERIVFLTQPWREIYISNEDRPYTYSDAVKINKHLGSTYLSLGYSLEYIPNASVKERVNFIINKVEKYNEQT